VRVRRIERDDGGKWTWEEKKQQQTPILGGMSHDKRITLFTVFS
jgi:hypothetical protein